MKECMLLDTRTWRSSHIGFCAMCVYCTYFEEALAGMESVSPEGSGVVVAAQGALSDLAPEGRPR